MTRIKTIKDADLGNKRVLVRVDFNVPLDTQGHVTDDTRIIAALPTIQYLIEQNAKVILVSHLGRPKGERNMKFSLEPVAAALAERLGQPVTFLDDCIGERIEASIAQMSPGSIVLLENVRFYPGEESNDPEFAKALAHLADAFVSDAFGTAHRAHASTVGVAERMPVKAAGPLIEKELAYLGDKISNPERPFTVILGGAKVSDKIKVIDALLEKADTLLIGGAMAYTFFLAQGKPVGDSLTEPDKVAVAKAILEKAAAKGIKLLLPVDNLIVDSIDFDTGTVGNTRIVEENSDDYIPEGWEGVDIGPKTAELFKQEIASAKTVLWNGPMGIFEIDACNQGTFAIAEAVAHSKATSIIGGGDSVTAIKKSGYSENVTFMSTGGGATLEFLEGQELPGIQVLQTASSSSSPKGKYLIVGNWKMNKNSEEALELIQKIRTEVGRQTGVQVVVCPPYTALESAARKLEGSNIQLGAQNMHYETSGAYTGEVSAEMLRHLFTTFVILGHSERRTHFGETDALIHKKLLAALKSNLKPILCIGETLEERKAGKTLEVVKAQLEGGLVDVPQNKVDTMVIAYEPVWAIGTGETATPQTAQEVHSVIRTWLEDRFDETIASRIKILYGGSMNPQNAGDLLAQSDIDGGLIGGAALKATSFLEIIEQAKKQSS